MEWSIKVICLIALLGTVALAQQEKNSWSWGSQPDESAGNHEFLVAEETQVYPEISNGTNSEVEDVIDTILSSTRQGKSIEGFDEVYKDPNVKQALNDGDDVQARNIIKDRLCSLGLMQCDGESVDPKRYVSPEDLIYAQPVDIKPVGRPVPSIPIRGPPRAYGPAKPVPFNGPPNGSPNGPHNGPPRKVGYAGPRPVYSSSKYGSPFGNGYDGPYLTKPPGSGGSYDGPYLTKPPSSGGSYDGPYLTKPPSSGAIYESGLVEPGPYDFERPVKHNKGSSFNSLASASSHSTDVAPIQQHVHHHYHHGEGNKQPAVIVNNPVPVATETHLHGSSLSSGYQSSSSGGFSPLDSGFNGVKNQYTQVKPVYEGNTPSLSSGLYNKGTYSQNTAGVYNLGYASGNAYNPSGGANLGSYSTGDQFYKKELNTNPNFAGNNLLGSGNTNYYSGSNQYSSQFGYGQESGRAESYDCVCVPYDQCPNENIIGRKDDLFLPIDPRNLPKDIEAVVDEKVVVTDGNGTMTVVRVPKMVEGQNITSSDAVKKVSKREVNDKASDSAKQANIEPRLRGSDYDGDDSRFGFLGKKVQPTFGVSFGLPHAGYGGYPLNPFGDNPVLNPYGSSIGGGGVNLGPLSVDPLVSVQVTKNDYGEKVVKPLVNLHVTPNSNLIHTLGSLFSYKKGLLFNKFGPHDYGYGGHPIQHAHYHYGPYRPRPPPIHHYNPPPFLSRPPHHYGPGPYEGVYRDADIIDDEGPEYEPHHHEDYDDFNLNTHGGDYYGRSINQNNRQAQTQSQPQPQSNAYAQAYSYDKTIPPQAPGQAQGGRNVKFPTSRRRREVSKSEDSKSPTNDESAPRNNPAKRQAFYQPQQQLLQQCGPRQVCCRRQYRPQLQQQNQGLNRGQCGTRHSQGINGRIKNPVYVDGDSEFGEYPWQVAILKKDPKESVYVCGGTLIDHLHIVTAAHCVKTFTGFDLRVRLGEWDVNHDVEFYPYIERDIVSVHIHPQYYAGTLDNDLAILKMDHPVDWTKYPHISPACLPDKYTDYTGARCWTTGWGKDAFGDFGKYQNILKEVDVPVIGHNQCQSQLRQTRLGYQYQLNPGFICAGGEEGKDACKGDGGGPMVCERGGTWQLVGVVSWGIGCGQVNVPGVYVKVAHYLDWIAQITSSGRF